MQNRTFLVLLRPIFCEKLKIALPHRKTAPLKRLDFRIWLKDQSQFRWRPFFFFFFGDHLNLGRKNVWISEFGRKISLNFGEDLFFFWRPPDFGRKNVWISEISEKFRLNFRTNCVKLNQEQWKFGSRSFALFSSFKIAPPLFQILATRLVSGPISKSLLYISATQLLWEKRCKKTCERYQSVGNIEFGLIDMGFEPLTYRSKHFTAWPIFRYGNRIKFKCRYENLKKTLLLALNLFRDKYFNEKILLYTIRIYTPWKA